MKNKSVLRLTVSLILVIALLGSFASPALAAVYPNDASREFTDGSRTYEAYMKKTANSEHITPITDTQVYHTQGIATNISITKTHETTWTGSGEITAQYSGYFIELAGTIGVANSTTHSVSTTVGFTIPESRESGYYRIEQRCPKYTVREMLSDITNYGIATVFQKTLQHMPGSNAGYYMLNKYQ
jgi:hypothetical protein